MKNRLMQLLLLLVVVGAAYLPQTLAQQTPPAAQAAQAPVKIEFDRRVRMRDGVELSADIYRPEAKGSYPVLLLRTPYTKTSASTLNTAKYFASKGYVFIAMDVRGRGDSDGKFKPYFNDAGDGYDAIEGAAAQEWSTGKVGTLGGSQQAVPVARCPADCAREAGLSVVSCQWSVGS